jgi:hypothetical protein
MQATTALTRQPYLKINRAKQHVNDLNGKVREYLAERPLRMVTAYDPETHKQTHTVKQYVPVPEEFALIIGDAVHNLRSALDIMVFGMIGNKTRKARAVQFPFAKDARGFVCAFKTREIESLTSPKVIEEFKALPPLL